MVSAGFSSRGQSLTSTSIPQTIQHPSLVAMFSSFTTPIYTALVLEYCDGGELFDFLASWHPHLSESLARRIFGELLSAVGWMHEICLVHRDIKLESQSRGPHIRACTICALAHKSCSSRYPPHRAAIPLRITVGRALDTPHAFRQIDRLWTLSLRQSGVASPRHPLRLRGIRGARAHHGQDVRRSADRRLGTRRRPLRHRDGRHAFRRVRLGRVARTQGLPAQDRQGRLSLAWTNVLVEDIVALGGFTTVTRARRVRLCLDGAGVNLELASHAAIGVPGCGHPRRAPSRSGPGQTCDSLPGLGHGMDARRRATGATKRNPPSAATRAESTSVGERVLGGLTRSMFQRFSSTVEHLLL